MIPDGLLAELETRRNHWLAVNSPPETLTRDIARQELETGQRETQLAAAREERDRRRAALLELRAERDALENGRRPLPGGAAPDAEEARLENAVREAEARLEEARRQAEAVRQDLAGLRRQTDMLRQATAERASHMEPLERDFRRRLELAGFADEADYRAACLSEEERERLRQEEQELRTEQTELDARRRDKAAQLAAERRRNVTPSPASRWPPPLQRCGKTPGGSRRPSAASARRWRKTGTSRKPAPRAPPPSPRSAGSTGAGARSTISSVRKAAKNTATSCRR